MIRGRTVIGPVGQVIRSARSVVNAYRALIADGDTSLDKLDPFIQVLEATLKVHDQLGARRRGSG